MPHNSPASTTRILALGERAEQLFDGAADEGSAADEKDLVITVEVVTRMTGLAALRRDYERLHRVSGNTLPFSLHDWHVTWCEHFLQHSGPIEDELRVCIARDPQERCVAIVPLVRTRRSLGAISVNELRMLGHDSGITEIREPLVLPGYETRVAHAIHDALAKLGEWDWVEWSGCSIEFREALALSPEYEWRESVLGYIIDLPDSWDIFHASLKRNIKRSLKHCYNSLARDGHASALVVNSTPVEIAAAIERFFVLHDQRAGLEGTVKHRSVFPGGPTRAFLRSACARLAERGIARVFELRIDDTVVASRVGFVVGDSLYLYFSGFDPKWGKYSVMTTAVAESIKYAIDQGLRTVNLSPGTDVSKTRWAPRATPIWSAERVRPRWRSRAARTAFVGVKSGRGPLGWIAPLFRRLKRRWE